MVIVVAYMIWTLPIQSNSLLSAIMKYGLARIWLLGIVILFTILRVVLFPWNMGHDLKLLPPDADGSIRYTVDVPALVEAKQMTRRERKEASKSKSHRE